MGLEALYPYFSPLLGGVIGYFTNWLAIKMLFRPYGEKRLFGLRIPFTPGLIPKEKANLAKSIGLSAKEHVLTNDVIAGALQSEEIRNGLNAAIETFFAQLPESKLKAHALRLAEEKLPLAGTAVLRFLEENSEFDENLRKLTHKVASENFGKLVGLFVNYDKVYDKIKAGILEYLESEENRGELVSKLNEFADGVISSEKNLNYMKGLAFDLIVRALDSAGVFIAENIHIDRLIEDRVNAFDTRQLEEVVVSVARKQLVAITWLGGLLGLIIGSAPLVVRIFSM